VFGMQTINLCAQRGILYFIHQAPPSVKGTFTYIAAGGQLAREEIAKTVGFCEFRLGIATAVTGITISEPQFAAVIRIVGDWTDQSMKKLIRIASSSGSA
jgi:hypothetical protein